MGSEQTLLSPLEQRVRRLAVLASVFAVLAAVLGMLPGGIELRPSWATDYKHPIGWTDTMHAGGWAVVIWAAGLGGLAVQMWRAPSRFGVEMLTCAAVVTFVSALLWGFEHCTEERYILRWPARLTLASAGTVCVLMFVALPLVLLLSDRSRPSEAPSARAMRA